MKATILACFVIITAFTTFNSPFTDTIKSPQKLDSVYICFSATAHVYHSRPACRGLNRCSHSIIKVSLKDAIKKYARRACKICE